MQVDKRIDLNATVTQIQNGASLLIGGWGPFRKPMALIRAIAQSTLKDLTIMSYAGLDLDLLIGAGKVKTAIFGFASFEGAPGAPAFFKQARQQGRIEFKELSEYMLIARLKAAAERLPFYPTRSGLGSDILTVNPEIKKIEDPYTGQTLVAVPAFTPDFTLVHVNEADEMGNSRIVGDPYLDRLFVRAANKTIVTAERILPQGQIQASTFLGTWVDGVIEVPNGAYPGECYPDYEISATGFKKYQEATKDGDAFNDYLGGVVQGGGN